MVLYTGLRLADWRGHDMARNSNASYESDDNRRVPLSGVDTSLNYKDFATIDDFVRATNGTVLQVNRGCSFAFRDTGGWGPRKTAGDWYRCLIVRYQNIIGVEHGVLGTALLTVGANIYLGYITGTTTFTVTWYSLVEEGGIMREAVPASLGGNCALNGHFVAGHTGWTAMTSHDQNNINTRYRFQLGGDGVLYVFKTTQGDGGYSAIGRVLRDDQISTWTAKTLTANSSYVNSLGSWTRCYYNSAIKLATLNFNFCINTAVSAANTILISGLPKPFAASACDVSPQQGGTSIRLYVHTDGTLKTDQAAAVGWYNGSVTYPYSSL